MRSSSPLLAAIALFSAPSLQFADTKTIFQFPNPTWLENVHATRTGTLLTGVIGVPQLYLVDQFKTPATSSLVFTFPSGTGVFGITDIGTEEYAVATGNYSLPTGEGTIFSVWSINLQAKKQRKIAEFPGSKLLNGMTNLDERTLLIADSVLGHVLKLDAVTGNYSIAIDHPSMKPVQGAPFPLGINGLKFRNGYLYWTNTFQNTLTRVKLNRNGQAVGSFETVSDQVFVPDDFAVTVEGDAIVGRPFANVVDRVRPNGSIETLAGNINSTVVAGTTGVTLGRTWKDANVAYVCTNGGQSTPVNGTIEGGKIVAIKLR